MIGPAYVLSVWLLYEPTTEPVQWEVPSLEVCVAEADLWQKVAQEWQKRTEYGGAQHLVEPIVSRCDPIGEQI